METMELIKKTKENDSEAYQKLLAMYHKMIHSIINEYTLEYGDFRISKDDLYQEACIALYDACVGYEENKKIKFSTYAYVVIKRRILRFYRICMNAYVKESISIDAIDALDHFKAMESIQVSDNAIMYECEKKLRNKNYRNSVRIDEEERDILLLRLEDRSYDEISQILKINRKKVDNRLTRLKNKFIKNE